MHKELYNMLERFPEYRGNIIELFNSNEDFKSLCDDYWQCKNALLKFREHVLEDAQVENEYRQLCMDLEQDAFRFFDRSP